MILINNLLIMFAFAMFASHSAMEELNQGPQTLMEQVVERDPLPLPLDHESRFESSDLSR